ncbi:hypothetical protein [Aeromonas veronii]|uniref:hypothetical protein n=1 Tax=Aeromonas veronii TaxID=654 RepID=UPI0024439449|nr:hypothetical protein [Aeromonas veronii]
MKILFASGMIIFLALLIFLSGVFYVRNKLKFNDSRAVLLFMDSVMFKSCWLTNLASIFFFISCAMGLALSLVNGEPHQRFISYCVGFLGVILLFFHCRLQYVRNHEVGDFSFLNELTLKYEFSSSSVLIWLSRLCYLVSFFMLFYYGC